MARVPEFASEYDRVMLESGPASIFTVDAKWWVRLDVERTRELWILYGPVPREAPRHFVLTDSVTGLCLYILVTHVSLAERQPRGTVEEVPDMATGLARVDAAWAERRAPG